MSIALMSAVWALDLQPSDKMVLLALADAANDDGVTWIAVRTKADKLDLLTKCSLSERAIQGAIKRLCEAGLLSRDERPGKGVIYHVTLSSQAAKSTAPVLADPRTICAPTPADAAPPQQLRPAANDADPRSSCGETVNNPQLISEAKASSIHDVASGNDNEPVFALTTPAPTKRRGGSKVGPTTEEQAAFDAFWAVYPRRVAKLPALTAFVAAVRSGVEPQAIFEGASAYAIDRDGKDPDRTAHAATWLNGRRWEDEISAPGRAGSDGAPRQPLGWTALDMAAEAVGWDSHQEPAR